MFRTACIFVALALCAATAPPRISLDLAAWADSPHLKTAKASTDYFKAIEINATAKALPIAKAFDHVDQEVSVTTIVQLVDLDEDGNVVAISTTTNTHDLNTAGIKTTADLDTSTNPASSSYTGGPAPCAKASEQRSEYAFTYDAVDATGNNAEQLTFVLLIHDEVAPVLGTECSDAALEAGDETVLAKACGGTKETCTANSEMNRGQAGACDKTLKEERTVLTGATYDQDTASLSCSACQAMDTTLTFTCTDKAGVYGSNQAANTVVKTIQLSCEDKTPPTVTVATNAATEAVECGVGPLADPPVFEDIGPSWDAATVLTTEVTGILTTEGTHTQIWTGTDDCFDLTATHTRVYTVVDSTPPAFTFGNAGAPVAVLIHSHSDLHDDEADTQELGKTLASGTSWDNITTFVDNKLQDSASGWAITDECYQATTTITTKTWYECPNDDCSESSRVVYDTSLPANEKPKEGTYHREYTIDDGADTPNTFTLGHDVVLTDPEKPVITVQDCENHSYSGLSHECDTNVNSTLDSLFPYEDAGAKCSDFVDGALSHAVEVSGDVVNLNLAGGNDCLSDVSHTYTIKYNCADLSGNTALQATRNVIVSDNEAPVLTAFSDSELEYEAGYTYTDAPPTVSDNMCVGSTGCITAASSVQLNDNVVTEVDETVPGVYKITYSATDCSGNVATPELIRTVTIVDTMAPVIVLSHPDDNTKLFSHPIGDHSKSTASSIGATSAFDASSAGRKDIVQVPSSPSNQWIPSYSFNGSLMAESASVNGWFIGAIACAITGVALLGLATRKVSTEVPV